LLLYSSRLPLGVPNGLVIDQASIAPGALPRPGRVPEQRLLSPEICLWWRRYCGTILGKMPIDLGFSVLRLLIGEGASLGVDQGGLTTGGRSQGLGHAPWWWGCPLAPLRLPFGPRPSSGQNRSFGLCFV
jgi:hypothetical protein